MTQPYSSDLRERLVQAHLAGEPIRQMAARFGVSVSSAPKWVARYRETESVPPGKVGGRNMVGDDFAVIAGRDHHDLGSTARREFRILVDVHPGFSSRVVDRFSSPIRFRDSAPDGQPIERSHLAGC